MKKLRIPWKKVEAWLRDKARFEPTYRFEPRQPCGCVLACYYGEAEGRELYFELGNVDEGDRRNPVYHADSEEFERAQIMAAKRLGREFLYPGEALLILDKLK